MKIGLDVLGGDYALYSTIQGAIEAQKILQDDQRLVLFGDEEKTRELIANAGGDLTAFDYVHAPDNIGMHEHPRKQSRKNPTPLFLKVLNF